MNLRAADYYLTRFAHRMPRALKLLGDLESDFLSERLDQITLDRPIFITGLARSGTTILLNLFAAHPSVGTHRYRDFPFLFVPVVWNRLQNRMTRTEPAIERPHRDRIWITKESPEAFEEPIWSHFFPRIHDADASHVLTAADANREFDVFFHGHLRKVLLLRGGKRYVSKGNYNVTRIEYLHRLFPEARFVVPVRHPVSQVYSLVRQHRLFMSYAERDPRIPGYMRAAGHYEFGPQRLPVNVDMNLSRRTREAWERGQDQLGYAIMWRAVYSHINSLAAGNRNIGRRIKVVRYEDVCADPVGFTRRLLDFCELTPEPVLASMPEISARGIGGDGDGVANIEEIWRETSDVASALGYRRDGLEP